jgi:hypothetical protein
MRDLLGAGSEWKSAKVPGMEKHTPRRAGWDPPAPPIRLRTNPLHQAVPARWVTTTQNAAAEPRKTETASQRYARNGDIREEIIGRTGCGLRGLLLRGGGLAEARRALALLEEPSGKQGSSAFLHPLIQKLADLFAEIGGVVQPGEFKALQRERRCGAKELPRRLGLRAVHARLLAGTLGYTNKEVIDVYYYCSVSICGNLWKTRRGEGCAGAGSREVRACSACAGDYEDPDATAPPAEVEEPLEQPELPVSSCGTWGCAAS